MSNFAVILVRCVPDAQTTAQQALSFAASFADNFSAFLAILPCPDALLFVVYLCMRGYPGAVILMVEKALECKLKIALSVFIQRLDFMVYWAEDVIVAVQT